MIRKLITALLFSVLTLNAMAQVDNGQRIAIMPVVSDDLQLPAEAKKALNQKLLQMTTQNGFGATSGAFVLTANVNTTNKIVSTTIPVQIVIDLEVSVYVVNLTENFIAAETSFNVQGMDANDTRAQVKAINSLNAKSPAVRKFMTTARENIIDYYTGRVTTIIAKAQSYADRGEYEDAIAILAGVPECLEEYPMVASKMTAIYTQMVDKSAEVAIQEAKAKMALKDYPAALDALMAVDPSSNRFKDASTMVESIKRAIEERDLRETEVRIQEMEAKKELALKLHDDEVMRQNNQIEGSKRSSENTMKSERSLKKVQKQLSDWLFGNL
ncbi:MAG: hypothetical protein J6V55_03985 [Alistipes sp.]|nr:hypothetical protein [Alistipes sp.]